MEFTEQEKTFYRKLFLRRYTLLINKVESIYKLDPDVKKRLTDRLMCLDWVDVGVERLQTRIESATTK
jgi:hypothetical protein